MKLVYEELENTIYIRVPNCSPKSMKKLAPKSSVSQSTKRKVTTISTNSRYELSILRKCEGKIWQSLYTMEFQTEANLQNQSRKDYKHQDIIL